MARALFLLLFLVACAPLAQRSFGRVVGTVGSWAWLAWRGLSEVLCFEALGASLGDLAAGGLRLSEPQIRQIAVSVLETLAGLHERGVVHRDLKLDHLLLGLDAGVRRWSARGEVVFVAVLAVARARACAGLGRMPGVWWRCLGRRARTLSASALVGG